MNQIMGDVIEPFSNNNLVVTWIFRHDNDPKLASKVLQNLIMSRFSIGQTKVQSKIQLTTYETTKFRLKQQKPSNLKEFYVVVYI